MATFDEIFQNYINYGFTRPTTPVPTVQGIESLATPMMTQPISDTSSVTESMAPTSTTTTGKSMGSLSMSDIGKALGFAMNPALGIANMAVQNMTGKSIAQQVMDAVQSMTGGGYGGRSSGYGVDSVAGMASGPTHGVDSVNEGSVGADASAGGAAGAAAASAAGSNDGPGGGTFAEGGRVGFADGTVIPFEKIKLFELVGEDLYGDWDTFSEVYDDYGADRMWKGISGRPGQYKGGIVSLNG